MSTNTQEFHKTSIHERLQLLRNKLQSFGIYSDTWLTLDKFVENMNKVRDWRKLDKRIVLQVFNNTDKGPNGTFQIEKFFQTYHETVDCLQHQKEAAEIYLKKLNDHKMEACSTLEQIQQESITSDQMQSESSLQIEVVEAKELNINSNEQVYVRISCENATVNTRLACYTNAARWNEKFKVPICTDSENINVILIAKSSASPARILGSIQLPVTSLKDQQLQDKWFSLNYSKGANACNKVRVRLQWIYSKVLYLQSTIEKLNEHITIQREDIKEFEKELHELDNLIPLVIIDPAPHPKTQMASFVSDHLSPKRLDFEVTVTDPDCNRNDKTSQPSSPNLLFKPPLGSMLSGSQTFKKCSSSMGSPIIKMTLPIFDHQCSQDQSRSIQNSPRLFSDKDTKFSKNGAQAYLKSLFGATSPIISPVQSTRNLCDPNENDLKPRLDNANKENHKLRLIIEEIKKENEALKREKDLSHPVPSYESKIHMLVDEVERLGRIVTDKNKEIEILKAQNEKLSHEKVSAVELENKVQEAMQENTRLTQLLTRKASVTLRQKPEQDENLDDIPQRKKEIFSVGPKFLNSLERSKAQISQTDVNNLYNFDRKQGPLQTRENLHNFPTQQTNLALHPVTPKILQRNIFSTNQ